MSKIDQTVNENRNKILILKKNITGGYMIKYVQRKAYRHLSGFNTKYLQSNG